MALFKANRYNRTHMTQLDYQAQMIIQAICRTQIRVHDPNKLTDVYFSEDWSEDLINYVDYYLNKNYSVKKITKLLNDQNWISNFIPRFRERISDLDDYFNGLIKQQILKVDEEREELNLYIPKYELVDIIPLNGSISHYDGLLTQLNYFKIRLTIGIPTSKYIKISKDGKLIPYTILQREIKDYLKNGFKIETRFRDYYI
jgi:hypothetical protein